MAAALPRAAVPVHLPRPAGLNIEVTEEVLVGCTTILVGKDASYDGSPLVARNEDSPNGEFHPKKIIVVKPGDQPREYTSVISKVTVPLPDDPMRYTAAPNAIPDQGIWAQAGINSANVAMSATETLTSNERVLGADPLVSGGIGEEDFVTLVLPYIHSAREGVVRLGALLEQYGTYEMNGVAFADADEIWWLETVGGHHWIARRVPDDVYVTMPNQLGIDSFDVEDALGEGREYLASSDLREFVADSFLNLSLDGNLNPRDAFGSHSDADHVYNTPRAWSMQRILNPNSTEYAPTSDDIPWCRHPERKITIEDIKYVLSSHYQGTPYDPYAGTDEQARLFRPIGINRHSQLSILQVRPESSRSIQWIAFASNPFNTLIPLYTNVEKMPDYVSDTTGRVTTENFYWASRILAALADAQFSAALPDIESYQQATLAAGHASLAKTDAEASLLVDGASVGGLLEAANEAITTTVKEATEAVLDKVLLIASNGMKNSFSRSDG